jgi:hypothetical protein
MSRGALYRGVFGDGLHTFRLGIEQLEELQESCDAGPEEVFYRVMNGTWRVKDIRETLRIGLIGGGMNNVKALVLVNRYAGDGAFGGLKPLVIGILGAAIDGAPDEDKPGSGDAPGEPQGEPSDSPAEK